MFAGISAAEAVSPQMASPAANSKKRKAMQASGSDGTDVNDQHDPDSDSDGDLNVLMQDSDSASDPNSEQDLELESELESELGSDLSQEIMEDRQTGMPAETSGRAAVTPGERTQSTMTPCLFCMGWAKQAYLHVAHVLHTSSVSLSCSGLQAYASSM